MSGLLEFIFFFVIMLLVTFILIVNFILNQYRFRRCVLVNCSSEQAPLSGCFEHDHENSVPLMSERGRGRWFLGATATF